jgi:hypothetical protein
MPKFSHHGSEYCPTCGRQSWGHAFKHDSDGNKDFTKIWAMKIFKIVQIPPVLVLISSGSMQYTEVTEKYIEKYDPQVGGYFVIDEKDQMSYLPEDKIESEYTMLDYEYTSAGYSERGVF